MSGAGLREHISHLLEALDEAQLTNLVMHIERQNGSSHSRGNSVSFAPSATDDDDDALTHSTSEAQTPTYGHLRAPESRAAANLFGPPATNVPNSARRSAGASARATAQAGDIEITVPDLPNDDVAQMSEPGTARQRGKRTGIAMPSVNVADAAEFKPRVIEKSPKEHEEVEKGVKECHLFSSMEDEELTIIINAMEREEFPPNHDILTQGQVSAAKFYLIGEGTVGVLKNGKNVASMEQGQFFGELEMMYDTQEPNAATIRTVTELVAYSLDQSTYKKIVLKVTIEKQKLYRELLNKVDFLESMSDYDKTTLADSLQPHKFEPDDYLIRFGERLQWMYFIVEGEAVVLGREKGKKKEIVRLHRGDVCGELEFLFNSAAGADVQAVSKVRTAKLSRKQFELCMGPITDELKRFVAKGKYEYFLASADKKVIQDISHAEKRGKARRIRADDTLALTHVQEGGEIVLVETFTDAFSEDNKKRQVMHRVPLQPVEALGVMIFGLREDGTICTWNDAAARITSYPAEQMIGASIYTFLLNQRDQKTMHDQISTVQRFAGNVDGYSSWKQEEGTKDKFEITFARADGLTRSRLALELLPPCLAQKGDGVETLVCIGTEVKQKPQQSSLDHGQWLADQIREFAAESKTESVSIELLRTVCDKFDAVKQGNTIDSDNFRPVNIRQLIGQVTTNFHAEAHTKNNSIVSQIDPSLPDELYCDTIVLPEIFKFALSNAVSRCSNQKIAVQSTLVDDLGLEMFEVVVTDAGTPIDPATVRDFNKGREKGDTKVMLKVNAAMHNLGGSMTIQSNKESTRLVFRLPFLHVRQDTMMSIESEMSASIMPAQGKKLTYTTLVIEASAPHRNMISAFLWERKHAVLPAMSMSDVQTLIPSADILVVDPQQDILDVSNVASYLKSMLSQAAIVITGENIDATTKESYLAAGFFTLTKPCTAMQATAVFRAAEDRMMKIKQEAEKIAQTRETFAKTNRGEMVKVRVLGKGAFGEVFEVQDKLTGGKMAMKEIRCSSDMNRAELFNEIEVMCTLQHKNIIHYFYAEDNSKEALLAKLKQKQAEAQATGEAFDVDIQETVDKHQETIEVFMEYAGGGTLSGRLKKGPLSEDELRTIIRDVVEGIAYCHQQRFVHCDLKTDNVLFSGDGRALLGDFGTTHRLAEGEKIYDMMGTFMYMSPECLGADREEGIGMDFKTDIWSLGAIVLECATGKQPLSHIPGINIGSGMSITNYVCNIKEPDTTPDLSVLFDMPKVFEFVSACMQIDPENRPSATQLLEYALLNANSDDVDMKTALKNIKKAQLLQVLNKFVAFQDPDEVSKCKDAQSGGGFFDSDEDEDDDSDKPKKKSFFDSTDEDEEEEEDDDDAGTMEKQETTPIAAETAEDKGPDTVNAASVPPIPLKSALKSGGTISPHPPEQSQPKQRPKSTTPEDVRSPNSEHSAIALHDALMILVSKLDKVGIATDDLSDAMKAQYAKATGDGGNASKFDPDVGDLLLKDCQTLATLIKRIEDK